MPPEEIDQRRNAIINDPSYRLAEEDTLFLKADDLRPVRVQLELLKTELILDRNRIESTIVVFGGTQVVQREVAERVWSVRGRRWPRHRTTGSCSGR